MDQKYVPSGVCLLCDKGTLPGRLTVSFNLQATIYGANLATESDKQPLLNITPMGVCAMSRMPCLPQPTQWLGLQNDVLVNGQRLLLEDSRLPCMLGGQIRISLIATPPSLGAGLLDSLDSSLATLGPVGDVLRTDLGIAEGVVGGVVALAEGVWSLAKLSAKMNMAMGNALLHPVDSAQSAWHGAKAAGEWASKGENWNKAWDASQEALGKADQAMYDAQDWVTDGRGAAWASQQSPRDWGRLGGRGAFEAFMLVGTGGLGEAASTAGKVGKVASLAERGVETTNLLEKGSETASAAGKLARSGPVTNGAEAGAKVATKAEAAVRAKQGAETLETVQGASKDARVCEGEPVDVATGDMLFDAVDIELPGPVPFVWERTWYSTSRRQGPLGHGWHHRYDQALWQGSTGELYLRLADGRLASFEPLTVENKFCAYHRGERLKLRSDGAGYAIEALREQLTYYFGCLVPPSSAAEALYQLLRIEDAHGHALKFTYTGSGYLSSIMDSTGRTIGVRTDEAGRIQALDLPHADGQPGTFVAVQYAYDAAGNMTVVTDAEGHTTHASYEKHLLTKRTYRNGISFYFTYDSQQRCTRTWGDSNLFNRHFYYEPGHTLVLTNEPATRQEFYHNAGLVTRHIDGVGSVREWYYNSHGELELVRNPLGQVTIYDYDGQGNQVGVTYPGGACIQTEFTAHGQPSKGVSATGGNWHYVYDTLGQLVERSDALGAITRYHYDDHGRLQQVTDALGHFTRMNYDIQHNLVQIVTANGHVRSRTYDALGRLVTRTNELGHTQRYYHDRLGQLVGVQEPDGTRRTLAYDGEGNMVCATNGQQAEVTCEYMGINRLIRRCQAGQEVRFHYDLDGELVSFSNELGHTYQLRRDAAGRVTEEIGFDGIIRQYVRDPAGRVTQVRRPAGYTTDYTYDAAGQLTYVTYSDGTYQQYAYDAAGALTEARTATSIVSLERDAMGRVLTETQNEHTVMHAYDNRGQRTTLQSSLGAALTWTHEAQGLVTAMESATGWQAALTYNALGQEVQRTAGGVRTQWVYDAAGRPQQQQFSTLTAGHYTERYRRYQWQHLDQLTGIEDSSSGTAQFAYDTWGSLLSAAYPDSSPELRQPDVAGNLFRTPARTDRRYGKGGQLREANGTRYAYDGEGNLTQKTLPNGHIWRYAWDGAGQLLGVTRPDGYAVTFTYDGLGRRLSKRFRGRVTKWVWDGDKPLHEWTELEVGPGAGSISDLTTWLFEEDSFVPAAKLTAQGAYSVVCDYLGTPLTLYNTQGQPTWDMSLDSYGGVRTGKGQPQDCPFRYQGQYEDVETGLYYNRFRYFDPETSQYLSQDPLRLLGGHRLYAYVDNPLSKFDRYGLSGCKLTTGTAVIHHSPGANPREFGHYSIETRLVNENGEVIKTTYTHQVTTPDGSQTWIKKLDGPHEDFTHSSEPIELSNIEEAQLYQNKMTRGWPTGGYDVRTNSCVTHVSNVLRKGGVDIGEGAFSQIKYLKKLPYIPK